MWCLQISSIWQLVKVVIELLLMATAGSLCEGLCLKCMDTCKPPTQRRKQRQCQGRSRTPASALKLMPSCIVRLPSDQIKQRVCIGILPFCCKAYDGEQMLRIL